MAKRGRPKGTTKDPNRRRVLNINNRKIDYQGSQYMKLINNGYKLSDDGKKIIPNPLFTGDRNAKKPVGRPREYVVTRNEINKLQNKGYWFDKQSRSVIKPSIKKEVAFENAIASYDLTLANTKDPLIQMQKLDPRVYVLLNKLLNKNQGISFNIGMDLEFSKPNPDNPEENIISEFHFVENASQITHTNEIGNALSSQNDKINRRIDRFTNGGSGWRLTAIKRHHLNISKYDPLAASSYIPLPDSIQNKKSTINIQNIDNDKCFMYCLGRALDPHPEADHLERVSKHLKDVCIELGVDKIKVPVKINDIPKIEKQFGASINVFGHQQENIYPIKITQSK